LITARRAADLAAAPICWSGRLCRIRMVVLSRGSPGRSVPELLSVGPGRVLQVPQVACCAHGAAEQLFGFGRLACVPCVYGVLGQGPGWFLE
jgi:hypothetical protein